MDVAPAASRARRGTHTTRPLGDHVNPEVTDGRPHHPVVVAHQAERAADVQLRIADAITAFAGSMRFVYLHAALFAIWMLVIESDPWPKLTLIVSLGPSSCPRSS
jgi:hypothetical protein